MAIILLKWRIAEIQFIIELPKYYRTYNYENINCFICSRCTVIYVVQ